MTETATLWTGTYWTSGDGSRDFTSDNTEPVSLAWVSSGNAYASGTALAIENGIDYWGPGSDTIQVGGRDPTVNNSNPFTGDIYAIRTYYSTQLSAYEIAYNAKVDEARFFMPDGGQSLTWKGPEATLAGGAFGSNGCWTVAGKRQSRAIPTIGDRVSLPAGDYTVTLDEATWALGSLSIGAGVKLKLPALPSGAYDSSKAILTLSGGIAADATAGLVLENAEAFCVHNKQITLLSCGADSTAALRNLAASVNATLSIGKVRVVDGTSLEFKAPTGLLISIQ
jgi:hypothetical protein